MSQVGVSMGGMISQCLALRHPQLVKTLSSVMSTTGDHELQRPKLSTLIALASLPTKTEDGRARDFKKKAKIIGR